jgi:hypothetical protein
MALLFPQPGDRGEPDVKTGRTGGSAVGEHRRLVRNGIQVLARGALACPECSLPMSPTPRVRPRAELRCAFCDHAAPAVEFLREGLHVPEAARVALVARLGTD